MAVHSHNFEYFTLAQGGSFVHGGPRLGEFPNRPFAIVESRQYGWISSLPTEVEEKSDSASAWETFSELVPRQPDQPVPTENSILVLKKRKRRAKGNEIGWALKPLCSHGWIHKLSTA